MDLAGPSTESAEASVFDRRSSKMYARRGTVATVSDLRRGSLQVDDGEMMDGLRDKGGGEPAQQDEAFASSLRDSHAQLDELMGATLERVTEVQEAAAEMLTPGARAEFEAAVRDVFDGLLRNTKQIAKELSEADSKTARGQGKAAAKLFQAKLEHARTAANMSLKNKSIEMNATFHKKLLEKVKELNEGARPTGPRAPPAPARARTCARTHLRRVHACGRAAPWPAA